MDGPLRDLSDEKVDDNHLQLHQPLNQPLEEENIVDRLPNDLTTYRPGPTSTHNLLPFTSRLNVPTQAFCLSTLVGAGLSYSAAQYPFLQQIGSLLVAVSLNEVLARFLVRNEEHLLTTIQRHLPSSIDGLELEKNNISAALKKKLDSVINIVFSNIPTAFQSTKNKLSLYNSVTKIWEAANGAYEITKSEDKVVKEFQQLLFTVLNDFHKNCHTIQGRVNKDLGAISNMAGMKNLVLTKVEMDTGETHNKGQTVCFLHFTEKKEGTGYDCVYKPRDVQIDALICGSGHNSLFQVLDYPELTYRYLPRGGYGYVEYLHQDKANSHEQLLNLSRQLGIYEMVGRAIGLRDLHSQNRLEVQDILFLIDCEVFGDSDLLSGQGVTEIGSEPEERFTKDKQQEQYYETFKNSFREAKEKLQSKSEELRSWVQQLPNDLAFRYVPLATTELTSLLRSLPLTNNQEMLEGFLEDRKQVIQGTTYQEFDCKLVAKHILKDLYHRDVPRFERKLNNCVYLHYQEVLHPVNEQGVQELVLNRLATLDEIKFDEEDMKAFFSIT